MTEFEGLVAVVTGGASGIGAATAALLADRGARVAILDRDVAHVDVTAVIAITCDITSATAVDAAVAEVARTLGGIDIVVNNAGIGAVGDVAANSDEEWHRVFDVNVVGIARVSRAALPYLRQSAHAAIVNVSSVVAVVGVPQRAVYAASKGAVAALTLAMAADHVKDGIRVNAVTPGTADTPWVGRLLEQAADAAAASVGAARQAADGPPRHCRTRSRTASPIWPARCLHRPPELCSPSTVAWVGSGLVSTCDDGLNLRKTVDELAQRCAVGHGADTDRAAAHCRRVRPQVCTTAAVCGCRAVRGIANPDRRGELGCGRTDLRSVDNPAPVKFFRYIEQSSDSQKAIVTLGSPTRRALANPSSRVGR